MATIAKAAEIIAEHPDLADFVGGVPFEEVWVAEQELGVTFPESYRDFLQKYGSGSFGGQTVYGLGVPDDGLPHVVWATHSLQEQDDWFPADLMVIQDTGEGDILCLAASRTSPDYPGECPIVQWIPEMSFEEQAFEEVYKTFAHFLLRMVKQVVGA